MVSRNRNDLPFIVHSKKLRKEEKMKKKEEGFFFGNVEMLRIRSLVIYGQFTQQF